ITASTQPRTRERAVLFLSLHGVLRALLSFPTRRSSDLRSCWRWPNVPGSRSAPTGGVVDGPADRRADRVGDHPTTPPLVDPVHGPNHQRTRVARLGVPGLFRLRRIAPQAPVRFTGHPPTLRVGGVGQVTPAPVAHLFLVLGPGQYGVSVLVVPLRLPNRDRSDQASVVVVFVRRYFFRLPPREAARGDTEAGRCSDFPSVFPAVSEARGEKGTLTSLLLRFQAVSSRLSYWAELRASISLDTWSSFNSGLTMLRGISASKKVSELKPNPLSASSPFLGG